MGHDDTLQDGLTSIYRRPAANQRAADRPGAQQPIRDHHVESHKIPTNTHTHVMIKDATVKPYHLLRPLLAGCGEIQYRPLLAE